MAQGLRAALDDVADLLRDDGRRGRMLERRSEHVAKALNLRVLRIDRCVFDASSHPGVDDARLHDGDSHIERPHLLRERLARRL
jgi:hypothetical protein